MKYLVYTLFLITLSSTMILEDIESHQLTVPKVNYPVRFVYIDRINQWWPPEKIASGIGLPGYANDTIYNYVAFAFWTYSSGPVDIVNIWADPIKYFGPDSVFGTTKDQVQKNLKKKYNDAGIKVLISVFGATEFPTTANVDPTDCAIKLGNFVLQNNLDGVDIDWEDNPAMEAGTGQAWLITFQRKLRELLPNHTISHAPQGPYFKEEFYKNGAYITINKQVGSTIDFYNIQFYNQGNTKYDTYDALFVSSGGYFSGTAVNEIIKRGVPAKKLVVGKPVNPGDATNTGWMDSSALGAATTRAYNELQWYGGVMFWQYPSDLTGVAVKNAVGHLKELCALNKNCI